MADNKQKNVYQLKPESGEVRAMPLSHCQPISMALDLTINGLYVICVDNGEYSIRKKTFDGKIDEAIHDVPRSMFLYRA